MNIIKIIKGEDVLPPTRGNPPEQMNTTKTVMKNVNPLAANGMKEIKKQDKEAIKK